MIKNQLFFPLALVLNFFILVSSITYAQDTDNLKKVSFSIFFSSFLQLDSTKKRSINIKKVFDFEIIFESIALIVLSLRI